MSGPADTTKMPGQPGPESPTTARPLDLDDDDVQETGVLSTDEGASKTTPTAAAPATEDAPPPKPPRPMTEQQKNVQILKEAFPGIDEGVIRAVLTASGGRIDPAFNALLQMTDPDAVEPEEPPPPQPPRPAQQPALSQLEADEQYARQLAQHYENVGAYEERTSNRGPPQARGQALPRGRQQTGLNPNELHDDREHSFLDDDLPVIRENLRKGFLETQTTVNSWFNNIKKKINEEFNDEEQGPSAHTKAAREEFMGRQGRSGNRPSGDYDPYDADPELLSDDFAGMRFNSDGTPAQRPANPNLFKPPPPSSSPKPKVAFRDATEEIGDAYDASPKLPPKDGAKTSKWQPLSAVDPSPIADNDPFSLGDSDDEKDANKKGAGGDGIKMEDSERLSKATAEAMADSLVDEPKAKAGEGKKD